MWDINRENKEAADSAAFQPQYGNIEKSAPSMSSISFHLLLEFETFTDNFLQPLFSYVCKSDVNACKQYPKTCRVLACIY